MIFPLMFAELFAPVAKIVTFPPGPGAAASSKESNSEVLERLTATPVGLPLFNPMLPAAALRRRNFAEPRSAEETSIREFTATELLVEVRFTVPPLPWGSNGDCKYPVVASIGASISIGPAAVTLIIPPLPRVNGPSLLKLPPFAVIEAKSPPGATTNPSSVILRVTLPPLPGADGPIKFALRPLANNTGMAEPVLLSDPTVMLKSRGEKASFPLPMYIGETRDVLINEIVAALTVSTRTPPPNRPELLSMAILPPAVKVPATICGAIMSPAAATLEDRKSTRLNSSHSSISYAVFCLKKKTFQVAAST